MANGKFSHPRSSGDDQFMVPEVPGLNEELTQKLSSDTFFQETTVLPQSLCTEETTVLPQDFFSEETTVLPQDFFSEETTVLPDNRLLEEGFPKDPELQKPVPENPDDDSEDFDSDYTEDSPRIRKHKKIAIISLCSAALLILISIIIAVSILMTPPEDNGLILNNVTAAGVNLGGMTLEQAKDALWNATKDTYTQQDMVIQLPGDTISLSPAQTGAALDIEAVAKAAYNYGRTGSRAEQDAAKAQSQIGPYYIALLSYMELNTDYIRQAIEEYCAGYNSDFSESYYKFEGEKPALTGDTFDADAPCQTLLLNPGTSGQNLDVDALYNRVLDSYSFNIFQVEVDSTILGDMPTPLDLDAIFQQYCSEPLNATFDKSVKEVVPEVYGYTFDLEYAKALLAAAEPGTVVEIQMEYVTPAVRGCDFFANVLSSYETDHTNSQNRNTNLRLACAAINGYILLPGETFDYNQVLGQRTTEAGYKPAGAYANGETVNEIGGGICQVSSTLYYCALLADLEIVTRAPHTYLSSYMPYGMDAAVSWNGPDFRFRNNTDHPIRIEAELANGQVCVKLVGTDSKDYYVEMEYEILAWDTYETVYKEFTSDNAQGYTDGKVITTPYTGCTVKTYRCRYDKETKELISRDFEARSKYQSRDEVIAKIVNDSTQAPTENTTAPTEESTEPTTEATTTPTEESTEPTTEATTTPTEESTEPTTEATTAPTEESTEASTEASTAPSEESTEPSSESNEASTGET